MVVVGICTGYNRLVALFDTLKAALRLREAGFDEEKAGAIVSAFAEDIGERLATKEDIRRLDERIVHLGERLDKRIVHLGERLDERIVHLGERLDERVVHLDGRLDTAEERLEQRLVLRMGIMVTGATGVLLTAIGIATGVLASM